MFRVTGIVLLALSLFGTVRAQDFQLQQVATGFPQPTDVTHAGDGSGRLFVAQQSGLILVVQGTNVLTNPFLNISAVTTNAGEQGLLGIAFHPGYRTNGYLFAYFTNTNGSSNVVWRFTASPPSTNEVSVVTGTEIIRIPHPTYQNHNGGCIKFGRDGYLYIAPGDGGGACDPDANAQNLGVLLGKMLRIDVDSAAPYAIPPDNPFLGIAGARPEIWAYGLRNPFRFSFDRATGDLFIGDVGQEQQEEVDYQAAGSPGGQNYGWKCMEGLLSNTCATACAAPNMVLPIITYGHVSPGPCWSITGGYRYRGAKEVPMKGRYFFADYCSGRIWSATESNGAWSITTPLDTNDYSFATFGEDECGELYIASRVNPGYLFRIVAKDSDGDGVPDWYEQLFPGTAAEDHDGDGFTQLQEFLAGIDPENAGSALRITALTENLLTFTSEEGRSYVVEQRSDLSAGQWQPLTNVICAGAGETTVTTSSNLYYRVRLRQ